MISDGDRTENTSSPAAANAQPVDAFGVLRAKAEKILEEQVAHSAAHSQDGEKILSLDAARKTYHDLQVHQIELEMQNEELRRIQAELDFMLERYFELYDLAPAGYCTVSEEGLLLEVNLTIGTMLDTARRELVGQPIGRFIVEEDQDIYYLHRHNLFETGDSQTCNLRMVKKNGIPFWATLVATAAEAIDGTSLCRIVISDITELKKAQEEKSRHKLEILLKKAQRMQSIGRLAGGVAHDFNNMLGVIMGYTEMALEQVNPNQPLHSDLWEIRKAADRCADLTQQLLTFAGRQIVAPKVLDLNQAVEDKLKVLRRTMDEKIELIWLPGTDLWQVNMDQAQIGQILASLYNNAKDAIVGRGTITIQTENITLDEARCTGHPWLIPGAYVQLTVNDNGWGMDKETLDNLFEPFYTTKGGCKKAGLGLATVYGAVKQNNGFIDVTSEPERGTTFILYFPRYKMVKEKVQIEAAVQPAMASRGRILVVEDEPIVLELVTRLLGLKGYTVFATEDAVEAIRLAREHTGNIDLLLTDVTMPKMNGDELAHKLLAEDPSLKCLFMSGYTADIITDGGLLDEDIHFIQKPFAIDELTAKIEEVLKTKVRKTK